MIQLPMEDLPHHSQRTHHSTVMLSRVQKYSLLFLSRFKTQSKEKRPLWEKQQQQCTVGLSCQVDGSIHASLKQTKTDSHTGNALSTPCRLAFTILGDTIKGANGGEQAIALPSCDIYDSQ